MSALEKVVGKEPPTSTDESEMTFERYLAGEAVSGRDIEPYQKKRELTDKIPVWVVKFTGAGEKEELTGTSMRMPLTMLSQEASTHDVETVHQELVRNYNTWPGSIDSPQLMVKRQWMQLAIANVLATPKLVDEK